MLRSSKLSPRTSRLLAVLGILFASAASRAQQDGLGEVVVTAERRTENLMSAPVAVTALSGADLLDAGIKTVGDLNDHVPGVTNTPAPYGGSTSLSLSIRGIATPGASAN